jgi:3-mercaptopyruvate sulfurtransferase SseA
VAWPTAPDSSHLATRDYLAANYGRSGVEILDARGAGHGETMAAMEAADCAWRAGHIPHSLPVDFPSLLTRHGTFLPPAELRAAIGRVGPRPTTTVDLEAEFVVYDDGTSHGGTLGYVMLRMAGLAPVRYYPGGWEEWARRPASPRVRIIEATELRERLAAQDSNLADGPSPSLVLLDVRHAVAFEQGHIPGAVSLSALELADSLATLLTRHWPQIDRSHSQPVVYCYGPECIRSRNGATCLTQAGFSTVAWFRGGMRDWLGLGEEVRVSPDATMPPDLETRLKEKNRRPAAEATGRNR